ncbi:MAG TPA: hypothetical protein VGL92_06080 [Acidimicrobiia bacterium]|jgi:hypothetical protein
MPLSPRDRRTLIIFGAVTFVAALAFFLFVNKGSKAPTPATAAVPNINLNQGTGSPSPTPSPVAKKKKHKQVLVFAGRDPFCCNPSTSPVAITSPGATVSPAGTPAPGPSGGSSATFDGTTIVLVDIFTSEGTQQAQVEVDGTVYTVSAGDTFAGDFTLVSIDGTCADFLFQSQSFSLCETANK